MPTILGIILMFIIFTLIGGGVGFGIAVAILLYNVYIYSPFYTNKK